MFYRFLDELTQYRPVQSCAVNRENPTGEKGGAAKASSSLGPGRKGAPCISRIESGETVSLMDIQGAGTIRHIWCTVADETPAGRFLIRDLVLRIFWDGEKMPSVEVPLGDLFLNGFGVGYQVNSLAMTVNPNRGMNCYLPMPFRTGARITLENQHPGPVDAFFYQIDLERFGPERIAPETGYLHAQWRRQPLTERARDYVLLDEVHGRGQYIGTHLMVQSLSRYWYGEGEFKFYLDGDTEYPSLCSTGLEDYFGGAWSFGGQADEKGRMQEKTFCTAFAGYPFYSRDDTVHSEYFNRDVPPMRAFYRWHIPDPVFFEKDLRVTLQQIGSGPSGLFERQDDITSIAYWYQTLPHADFPPLPPAHERHPR